MAQENGSEFSVVFAGLGGQGALTFGQYLAEAAAGKYKSVTLFPLYASVMRGGESESTVIASDEEIASPIISEIQAAVATSPTMFRQIEKRVRPQGLLLIDSSIIKEQAQREDIRVLYLPAARIASEKLGEPLASNFLLMGAFLALTQVLPVELVEQTMEKKLKGTPRAHMLHLNTQALREGVALAAQSE